MSNEQWSEWIEWNGGECPLKSGERCCVKYRNGEIRNDVPAGASAGLVIAGGYGATDSYWRKDGHGVDIIAYRYRLNDNTMTEEEAELPAQEWAGSITDSEEEGKYGAYFRDVRHLDKIDVYRAVDLFGCEKHGHPISHAAKKLLLSGSRTGGKDVEEDVREAIDTLTRWLEMREEDRHAL